MLHFLRRYQRYFFMVITVVIVISFSFFGTYSTLTGGVREQVAFVDVTGQPVTRHELDEMVRFITTDADDKLFFGGAWGPNFLNDGVVKKDFLETGLLPLLAQEYPNLLRNEMEIRVKREGRFELYQHPASDMISTVNTWKLFAPEMIVYYDQVKQTKDPLSLDGLHARSHLYLAQRQFPAVALRQVLRYQEKQANIPYPDQALNYADLSLFGYHTVEDWFGPRLLRIVAEFILNAAAIAEKQGYEVTKGEAIADLYANADASFKQMASVGQLGVSSPTDYFNEQLRRMGLDQTQAAKVWRKVLLFRRLFQDMGHSVFVDLASWHPYLTYAKQTVQGDLYRLPESLRFRDFQSLQQFEVYLDSVTKRDKDKLALPTQFLTIEEVNTKTPQLLQKKYVIEMRSITKKEAANQIGLKETWNWELDPAHWETLVKRFPELGEKKHHTQEERIAILESLDSNTRNRIDQLARSAILDADKSILQKALEQAKSRKETLNLYQKGQGNVIAHLDNSEELRTLLDQAPLGERPNEGKLSLFTADDKTFYSITVLDRSDSFAIASFADAKNDGVLDRLLNKKLEAHYTKLREKKPEQFQQEDKSWKPLDSVREAVAADYFSAILKAVKADYIQGIVPLKPTDKMTNDFLASVRFFSYGRHVKDQLQKDPASAEIYVRTANTSKQPLTQGSQQNSAQQWQFVVAPFEIDRGNQHDLAEKMQAFALGENQWTKVQTPFTGDIAFFHLKKKEISANEEGARNAITTLREALNEDAQQLMMKGILHEIKAKNAISLNYMDTSEEEIEPIQQSEEG